MSRHGEERVLHGLPGLSAFPIVLNLGIYDGSSLYLGQSVSVERMTDSLVQALTG